MQTFLENLSNEVSVSKGPQDNIGSKNNNSKKINSLFGSSVTINNISNTTNMHSGYKNSQVKNSIRAEAKEWFETVKGCPPPYRIKNVYAYGSEDESVNKEANEYYELEERFVNRIDRNYEVLPHKKELYKILDEESNKIN